MNDDRWTQIETLVEQALALPSEDRAAFIQQACIGDQELQDEVTSLVSHQEKAFSFMDYFQEQVVAPSIDILALEQINEDHRIDTLIGHYHITDILGRGGMGIVYKARDTNLDRTVALKFLPSHLTGSDKNKQRFMREAKAAAALNHPNICTIHSVEQHEGQHFISMENIEGITLREKLETGDINHNKILDIAVHIAEALAEAHEKGIVHRDVKPGNIMVDSKDRIKVMDFGLAKLLHASRLTDHKTRIGTVHYMSPEQLDSKEFDHRADLWSMGVVLYEMIAGKRPFEGENDQEIIYSIQHDTPEPLDTTVTGVPEMLNKIVFKCLEKKPDQRYQSTDEMILDLHQVRIGFLEAQENRLSLFFRRRTRRKVIGFFTAMFAILFIGYWFWPFSDSSPPPATIAVLPLESVSTETEDIQFTDGVHEELINRLAGIGEITVIARSSVLGFEPRNRDLQDVGQQLGVSSLMEGTVRRIGDQLRVSVQLIDANSLATLWSGSFNDNIDDVFEIQSRIARQVAGELQASMTEDEEQRLDNRPTDNPEAYRFYMQGREYLSRVLSEENLLTAEKLLRQALEQDEEFTQAWGMLAFTYSQLYWYHGGDPDDLLKLEEAAEWALFYGPELPETYLANGVKLYWTSTDNRQILSHFEAALKKYPNHPNLNIMTAFAHRRLGNWEKLIEHLKIALELDPLKTNIYTELGWDYMLIRDYKQALETLDHLMKLELNPTTAFQDKALYRYFKDGDLEGYEELWDHIQPSDPITEQPYRWGYFNMLNRNWEEAIQGFKNINNEVIMGNDVLYILRDYMIGLLLEFHDHHPQSLDYYMKARTHLEALRDEYPNDFRFRIALGKVYAHLDEDEKAVQEGKRAAQLMPLSQDAFLGAVVQEDLAEIYTWSGKEELAIQTLEHVLSVPSMVHRNVLRLDPVWDPLRDNPRFQELIAGEDEPYLEGL